MTKGEDQAFPGLNNSGYHEGMTKREVFAMNADVPWSEISEMIKQSDLPLFLALKDAFAFRAKVQVMAADALIDALNAKP